MSDVIVNRIKTAVESTELLNAIEYFDANELNRYIDLAYRLYKSQNSKEEEVSVYKDGSEISKDGILVNAILTISLFTHFVNIGQINNDGAMWNFDVFLNEIILSYIEILKYESNINNPKWWEDCVEYGLTSYQQATKFYNSTC